LLRLPGVARRDLPAAIAFQADSLHPFGEDEAVWDWTRLGAGGAVLLGITRRPTLERFAALFAEAGVKISGFTFSGAALYSAIRLPGLAPPEGFLALGETEDGLEVYGESAARPFFSASLNWPAQKAAELAASELRLPAATAPLELPALLPSASGALAPEDALAYAAGLAGACPWRPVLLNLLPAEQRSSGSRAIFIPTAALAVLLLAALGLWAAISPVQQRSYLAALEGEITRLEPAAARAAQLDRATDAVRARTRLLDNFRRRSKADLDTVHELTRLLAHPIWLASLELAPGSIHLAGEAEQAGPLLKLLDSSPLLRNSEFVTPLARSGNNEAFRIRASREGVPQ
jgi:Tfp pilus assembly protein PilN